MKINFNDMMDYVRCPIVYLLKNVHGLDDTTQKIKFSKSIKSVLYHFYFKAMEDKIVGVEVLKNKWESLWFNDLSMADVLYGEQNEHKKLGYQGVDMIVNFHRLNWANPGRPLVVNHDFEVPIGRHIVTGTIDLVREIKDGRSKLVELVNFSTSNYQPDDWEIRTNLQISLQSYAFRREFGAVEQRLTSYYLRDSKKYSTIRDDEQLTRLENFVDIVCTSIESNFYFPRPSFLCRGCKLKSYCENWGIK